MYTHVIYVMVGAAVAKQLHEPEYMNKDGKILEESKCFVCKVLIYMNGLAYVL